MRLLAQGPFGTVYRRTAPNPRSPSSERPAPRGGLRRSAPRANAVDAYGRLGIPAAERHAAAALAARPAAARGGSAARCGDVEM